MRENKPLPSLESVIVVQSGTARKIVPERKTRHHEHFRHDRVLISPCTGHIGLAIHYLRGNEVPHGLGDPDAVSTLIGDIRSRGGT
jgi:hypothetical protein